MFGQDPSHKSPATDTTFGLLSNGRRRRLLEEVNRAEQVGLREVARRIAASERDVPRSEVDDPACKSVYVSLYQTHVPRLEEHDVVEYDGGTRTVSLVRSPTTRRLLRVSGNGTPRPWGRYYAAAAVAGAGLLLTVGAATGEPGAAWRAVGTVVGGLLVGTVAGEVGWLRSVRNRSAAKLRPYL